MQHKLVSAGRGNAPQVLGIAGYDEVCASQCAHHDDGIDEIVLTCSPLAPSAAPAERTWASLSGSTR
jgi:hypothetical protein